MTKFSATVRITTIQSLEDVQNNLASLQTLLISSVNVDPSTSSIGFVAPLDNERAMQFWLDLVPSLTGPNPEVAMMVAISEETGDAIGSVLVARMLKETHSHRGEVRKLAVRPDYQGRGIGKLLMEAIETHARKFMNLDFLVLSTATDTPARVFYQKTGWTEWGICPDYAKLANGKKTRVSFFHKKLVEAGSTKDYGNLQN